MMIPIISRLTHFSEPNLICYGLLPLRRVRLPAAELRELPQRLRDLVASGRHQDFVRWGNGYLRGYGRARAMDHEPPRRVLQILAGNVAGPAWLAVVLGAVLRRPQIIKLLHRDLASFMFFLQSTCQERVVVVKPIDDVRDVARHLTHLAANLETVGLAVPTAELPEVSQALGAAGVTNVKPVGAEYLLDLTEPHDGVFNTVQPCFTDGLRWTSVNFTDTDQAIARTLRIKADSLRELATAAASRTLPPDGRRR